MPFLFSRKVGKETDTILKKGGRCVGNQKNQKRRRKYKFFQWFFLIGSFCFFVWNSAAQTVQAAGGNAKIHFLTLPENTTAILLECNGRFGMVDSGEDSDYPDGSDPNYPQNPGISMIAGMGGRCDFVFILSWGKYRKFCSFISEHMHTAIISGQQMK